MLINPAAAMHIRNVDSSKTRLCSHRLLFLIADIVGFHSRGDSDDPFVGPNPRRENVFVPTTFDLRRDNPVPLW